MNKTLLIVGGLLLVMGTWLASGYNSLVQYDEEANKAYADIEADLQRRFDLIPNLVSTVQSAANFESSTFKEVTEARSAWAQAGTPGEKFEAANNMEGALSRLLVTVENYPELKATEAFRDLQSQLEGTENRINVSRKRYNTAVTDYNKQIRTFPTNLIAGFFNFDDRPAFEGVQGSETAPDVNSLFQR